MSAAERVVASRSTDSIVRNITNSEHLTKASSLSSTKFSCHSLHRHVKQTFCSNAPRQQVVITYTDVIFAGFTILSSKDKCGSVPQQVSAVVTAPVDTDRLSQSKATSVRRKILDIASPPYAGVTTRDGPNATLSARNEKPVIPSKYATDVLLQPRDDSVGLQVAIDNTCVAVCEESPRTVFLSIQDSNELTKLFCPSWVDRIDPIDHLLLKY